MINLYYSFVYPLLLYCTITWGNSDSSCLWPVFKLQKMTIRIICSLRKYDSTSSHFKFFRILKLPDLYQYLVNIFMYQHYRGKLPAIFNEYFTKLSTIHEHATRQKQMYRFPLYKTKIGNRFIKKNGDRSLAHPY